MSKVYLLSGLPGSGKSTYVANNLNDIPVVSRDIIRVDVMGIKNGEKAVGSKEQENKVTQIENALIDKYISEGIDFAIDDTNCGKFVIPLIERLHFLGAYIILVNINTPPSVCAARRKNDMPVEVIFRMAKFKQKIDEDLVDEVINVDYKS